jgi:hypothetical protein
MCRDPKIWGIQDSFLTTSQVLWSAWADLMKDLGYSSVGDAIDWNVLGGATTTNAVKGVGQ